LSKISAQERYMLLVRFLQGGDLEVKNRDGVHVKPVAEGTSYQVDRIIFSHDRASADIYWPQGCAEEVPASMIELHGDISLVKYKPAPKKEI
jgi:hypothetical protein